MNIEYIDELTGLYNRKGLTDLVNEYVDNDLVSVLFMDIDNFKTVNDLYGHSEGDKLLKSFSNIISSIAEEIFPVRLGGDEFVLILKGRRSRKEINRIFDKLSERVRKKRTELIGFSVISVSIGIVRNIRINSDNMSEILHNADLSLYDAKNKGKSCCIFYEDIAQDLRNREIIERKAESAIKEDGFEIKFQPVIHLQTSSIVSIDIRFLWKKNDREYWNTRDYREIFEKNGYIRRFDSYMFERACQEISRIKKSTGKSYIYNIMLSRLSFLSPQIGNEMLEIMGKYELTFQDLEISIEESAFGIRGEDELLKAIHELSELGFSISLTKFGYNFESIKYLPHLDIKSLRIDGYYIDNNYKDSKGGQILRTLIRMGKELKFHVIGYGEITKDKIDFLNGCGCDSLANVSEAGAMEGEAFIEFISSHQQEGTKNYIFKFHNNLSTEDGDFEGKAIGHIEYGPGVCSEYGAIVLRGGDRGNNLVELPCNIMASDSYTISMWIRPDKEGIYVSAFYARYEGGFMSLMPYIAETSTSSYRIHEDINVDVWYDAICRSVEINKWNYLTISYNSFNETMRCYINGRKAVTRRDVPTLYSCRDCLVGGDHFQKSFEGAISGLSICNQSKSDDDIAQMYKSFLSLEGFCGVKESFWMDNK